MWFPEGMLQASRLICPLVFSFGFAFASLTDDLLVLQQIGSRETGTMGNAQARAYLEEQFRTLGYDTRQEPFSYTRFQDYGSEVRVGSVRFAARALQGGPGMQLDAPAVWVSGVGTGADFHKAGVRGKVAVIARGGMLFRDKARNARTAGAVALVIINSERGVYRGAIGEAVGIPVLSVAPDARTALRGAARLFLKVDLKFETVRGANVIAQLPGARPEVLFGAHHDSFIFSPGINDNASGVLGVLELARELRGSDQARRVMFALFDGEEDRFQGSRSFVKTHAALLPRLRGMLNLDMIGVNAEPLAVNGSATLVRLAQRVVPGLRSFSDSGLSDHESFMAAGVPGLFFFRGLDPNYHLPSDTGADATLIRETAGLP